MRGINPATPRLKSRKSYFSSVPPLDPQTTRNLETQKQWQELTDSIPNCQKIQNFKVEERLPPSHELQWKEWQCLNRLRSGVGKTKELMLKWGYFPPNTNITCNCGLHPQTMDHLLTCKNKRDFLQSKRSDGM